MQDRPYQTIVASVGDAGALTLTLNRPEKRNAIGSQMVNELLWALADAHQDAAVRSIVLTGAGKAFCAGGDFAQMTGGGSENQLPIKGDYKDLLLALWRTTKPVIARINGHALGGGLGLVAASTFAIASTEAKLGTPEINVGLFPFMIMAVLQRVMPRRRLVEMMLSGERLSAEQAEAVGLVNKAVAPAELDAEVSRIATMIASKSPSTIRLGLEALRDTEELSLDDKLPILSSRLLACLGTDDAREGLMAFLEKREPKWSGH
jgi:enoyl-CoA hydratase/carnithine racemase